VTSIDKGFRTLMEICQMVKELLHWSSRMSFHDAASTE